MTPGATTRPSASIVRLAEAPAYLPTPTIFPPCTATSAWNAGSPEPSTTRPFLISRSYAMVLSPHCPAPTEPRAITTGRSYRGFTTRQHHSYGARRSLRPAGGSGNNFPSTLHGYWQIILF